MTALLSRALPGLVLGIVTGFAPAQPASSSTPQQSSPVAMTASAPDSLGHTHDAWVERTLASLTLREKAGQLITAWIPGGFPPRGGSNWKRARELVLDDGVGGLIVGKGRAYATSAWLNDLQHHARVPLLVSADLEWGTGTRLAEATTLPMSMAISAAGDPEFAYRAGRITALEARAAGIHMAFAPVADVNIDPANPVINTRSYGASPNDVAEHVSAFIEGARSGGMLTVAKHFPGHGDTSVDSHLGLATLEVDRPRLDEVELVPFRAAIDSKVDAVMTAHLAVPALSPFLPAMPATLEHAILTGLLRDELGFEGLIVTDALNMDGVAKGRTSGEIALAALAAGADMLLMPANATRAIDAIVEAVEDGDLDVARIEASVRRILAAKAAAGLHEGRTVSSARVLAEVGTEEHQRVAQEIADRSITLLRGDAHGGIPYSVGRDGVREILLVLYDDGRRSIGAPFTDALAARGAFVRTVRLNRKSDRDRLRRIELEAISADLVIFATYARAVPWKGTLGLPDEVAELADHLAAGGAVTVSFGDPYVLGQIPRFGDYLLAWSDADVAQKAAARALTGEIGITGRLPIPLPPHYAIGDGLMLQSFAESLPVPEPGLSGHVR